MKQRGVRTSPVLEVSGRKKRAMSITRQVRFTQEQLKLVEAEADKQRLPVATFIRLATLSAAGLAKSEIDRMRRIADAMETMAASQVAS